MRLPEDILSKVVTEGKRLKEGEQKSFFPPGHPALRSNAKKSKKVEVTKIKKDKEKEEDKLFVNNLLQRAEGIDKQLKDFYDLSKQGIERFNDTPCLKVWVGNLIKITEGYHNMLSGLVKNISRKNNEG